MGNRLSFVYKSAEKKTRKIKNNNSLRIKLTIEATNGVKHVKFLSNCTYAWRTNLQLSTHAIIQHLIHLWRINFLFYFLEVNLPVTSAAVSSWSRWPFVFECICLVCPLFWSALSSSWTLNGRDCFRLDIITIIR